jgi:hypothetical protein
MCVVSNVFPHFIGSSSEISVVELGVWGFSLLAWFKLLSSSGGREAKGFFTTKLFLSGGGLGYHTDFF